MVEDIGKKSSTEQKGVKELLEKGDSGADQSKKLE